MVPLNTLYRDAGLLKIPPTHSLMHPALCAQARATWLPNVLRTSRKGYTRMVDRVNFVGRRLISLEIVNYGNKVLLLVYEAFRVPLY